MSLTSVTVCYCDPRYSWLLPLLNVQTNSNLLLYFLALYFILLCIQKQYSIMVWEKRLRVLNLEKNFMTTSLVEITIICPNFISLLEIPSWFNLSLVVAF